MHTQKNLQILNPRHQIQKESDFANLAPTARAPPVFQRRQGRLELLMAAFARRYTVTAIAKTHKAANNGLP